MALLSAVDIKWHGHQLGAVRALGVMYLLRHPAKTWAQLLVFPRRRTRGGSSWPQT